MNLFRASLTMMVLLCLCGVGCSSQAAPPPPETSSPATAPTIEDAAASFADLLVQQDVVGMISLFTADGLRDAASLEHLAGQLAEITQAPTVTAIEERENEDTATVVYLVPMAGSDVQMSVEWLLVDTIWKIATVRIDG